MIEKGTTMHCDECGREMPKAHRHHKGRRFCAICYARVFKRRMCPKCGNFARLPKNDENAVCKKCETDKPCIRCGNAEYEIGKITAYGPVCNSCAPHFREPKPCGLCGKLSSRLTRVKRTSIEVPVCPKCANRDHGTCKACRRHRLLTESPDGRMLCSTCLEKDKVPCFSCGNSMPAGRGKICEACYWEETFRKRLKMDQAAFSVRGMSEDFGEFGEWLLSEVGGHKSALSIHRYLPFFLEIEKQWQRIPGYLELLEWFGAEELRRVRLPMRWLNEAKAIFAVAISREEDSDRRRIEAIMSSVPDRSLASLVLIGYRSRLMDRYNASKSTLRSVRLALRPAVSLLLVADAMGNYLPNQAALDRYLLEVPGQKAAVTGFVNFLNKEYRLELLPRADENRVCEVRKKKLEAEIMTLMREIGGDKESRRKWLSAALAYFHGLPRKVGKGLKDEDITDACNGGLVVVWNRARYWVPYLGAEPTWS